MKKLSHKSTKVEPVTQTAGTPPSRRKRSSSDRLCGHKLYRWLIQTGYETAKTFQVLCANCNLKKEIVRQRMSRLV